MGDQELPLVYLARHGETAWSLSGQHTGLSDLPLTAVGERNGEKLKDALKRVTFTKVSLTSRVANVRTGWFQSQR
jgi:broad specificity phosphatase PhoE